MAMQAHQEGSHVSTPKKRIRWATQRAKAATGSKKRYHILERLQRRTASGERKRVSADGSQTEGFPHEGSAEELEDQDTVQRRIFFNIPLPDNAKDEDGRPLMKFGRNKIRTAKYTPLSFVPKNLYFQFHNIANIYFLFVIVVGVGQLCRTLSIDTDMGLSNLDIPNLRQPQSRFERSTAYLYRILDFGQRCHRRLAQDKP